MDVQQAIDKRYSCRSYINKSVKDKLIESVLESGLKAPNSGNIQNLKFVVIGDERKKEMIAEACNQKWINEAPVAKAVLSDLNSAKAVYKDKAEAYSTQNAAAAIENMLLTATSLELGSCWVSVFDNNKIRASLKLEPGIKPEGIITLGYSDKKESKAKRFNLSSFVFFEEWKGKQHKSLFPLKENLIDKTLKRLK